MTTGSDDPIHTVRVLFFSDHGNAHATLYGEDIMIPDVDCEVNDEIEIRVTKKGDNYYGECVSEWAQPDAETPSSGDVLTRPIDRFEDGEAIIELDTGQTVRLGALDCRPGTEVEFRVIGEGRYLKGRCLDRAYRDDKRHEQKSGTATKDDPYQGSKSETDLSDSRPANPNKHLLGDQ